MTNRVKRSLQKVTIAPMVPTGKPKPRPQGHVSFDTTTVFTDIDDQVQSLDDFFDEYSRFCNDNPTSTQTVEFILPKKKAQFIQNSPAFSPKDQTITDRTADIFGPFIANASNPITDVTDPTFTLLPKKSRPPIQSSSSPIQSPKFDESAIEADINKMARSTTARAIFSPVSGTDITESPFKPVPSRSSPFFPQKSRSPRAPIPSSFTIPSLPALNVLKTQLIQKPIPSQIDPQIIEYHNYIAQSELYQNVIDTSNLIKSVCSRITRSMPNNYNSPINSEQKLENLIAARQNIQMPDDSFQIKYQLLIDLLPYRVNSIKGNRVSLFVDGVNREDDLRNATPVYVALAQQNRKKKLTEEIYAILNETPHVICDNLTNLSFVISKPSVRVAISLRIPKSYPWGHLVVERIRVDYSTDLQETEKLIKQIVDDQSMGPNLILRTIRAMKNSL